MPLREALRKSDRNGRKKVRRRLLKAVFVGCVGLAFFLLLDIFGVNRADIENILVQNLHLGMSGVVAIGASIIIAYVSGFMEMFKKYRNTGKLDELALPVAGSGIFLTLLPSLGISGAQSDWFLPVGLALLAVGAAFWQDQRRRREYSS